MQITPAALDAIFYTINTIYQGAYARQQPWWNRVSMLVPSSGRENRYGWLRMLPRMREWVGERIYRNLEAAAYTLVNRDFELTLELKRNEIEDDLIGMYNGYIQMMAEQAARMSRLIDDLLSLSRIELSEHSPPVERIDLGAVAGRVLAVPHESEGVVQPGQALIDIGHPARLEVLVEVLSTAAVRIGVGSRVVLDRWGGPALEGRVRVVEPAGFTKVSALGVEEQRVRVLVDIVSPAELWRGLGDGYRIEAAFVLWQGDGLLLAPASALFRQGQGWALFVEEAGRARLRSVRVGQRNGLEAQILDGLKAGERVVAHPNEKIEAGVRIQGR